MKRDHCPDNEESDTVDKKIREDEDVASLCCHWHRLPHRPLSLGKRKSKVKRGNPKIEKVKRKI